MDTAAHDAFRAPDDGPLSNGTPPAGELPGEPPPDAIPGLVRQYVEEMRRDLGVPVPVPPPPAGVRRIRRLLALGVLGVGVAMAGSVVVIARMSPPPRVPAALAATPEGAACLARQERVLEALAAWTAGHGTPPPTLDALRPGYLGDAPADPASGRPFVYRRDATGIHLACPDHPVAPPALAPRAPGGAPPA